MDPLLFVSRPNPYAYARSRPAYRLDPPGLSDQDTGSEKQVERPQTLDEFAARDRSLLRPLGDGGAFEAALRYRVLNASFHGGKDLDEPPLSPSPWSELGGLLAWLAIKMGSRIATRPIPFWPVRITFRKLLEQAPKEVSGLNEPPPPPPIDRPKRWPESKPFHERSRTCPVEPGLRCHENSNCRSSPLYWCER